MKSKKRNKKFSNPRLAKIEALAHNLNAYYRWCMAVQQTRSWVGLKPLGAQ